MPWIFAIVVVLAVSGVMIAWLLSGGGGDRLAKNESPTPQPTASALPTREPTAEPTASPMFEVLNNTGFNGSRITYYARPSFEQCQADCAANSACKAFTWIRPGAYNAGDAAMCYLMSEVTARVPDNHSISAVRN